jgi:predicted deacetylase
MPVRRTVVMTARLVVALAGLAGSALDNVRALSAELDARAVPLAQFHAPHARLTDAARDWLTQRVHGGDELVLHGFRGPLGRRGQLAAHEAGLEMIAARAALHRLGLPARCFAPSRWLASPGTLATLRRNGFTTCAELHGVRDLRTDRLAAGRLTTFGHSARTDPWRGRAVVLGAGRTARRGGLVRIAVDAADLARPGVTQALLDAVDIARHHGAVPGTHAELVAPRLPQPRRPNQSRPGQTSVASAAGSTDTVVPAGLSPSNNP